MTNICNSPISWVGGKYKLSKIIIPLIPDHICYVEVFGGAGWVLFKKNPNISKVEVINDLDGELVNFFQVIQNNWREFVSLFRYEIVSRKRFNDLIDSGQSDNHIEKAKRFYYLIKCGFGGKIKDSCFPASRTSISNLNIYKIPRMIKAAHRRLSRVTIENLDFEECLKRYDSDETFFYIDPPYFGSENYYTSEFKKSDHQRLANILRQLKGKFILSINDTPETRRIYCKGMNIVKVETIYSISIDKIVDANEILVTNYKLKN